MVIFPSWKFNLSPQTTITQGALSGGGWITGFSKSDDSVTCTIVYDGNGYWYSSYPPFTRWNDALSQSQMPAAHEPWGHVDSLGQATGFRCSVQAVAPSDSNTLYAVIYAQTNTPAYLWKKTSGFASPWTDTGWYIPSSDSHAPTGFISQPSIAVDPQNPSVALISDDAGAIHYTDDGFTTKKILNAPSGPLAGILPEAVISSYNSGTRVLTVDAVPASVQSPGSLTYYISDVGSSYPSATGNNTLPNQVVVTDSTTTTVTTTAVVSSTDAPGSTGFVNNDTVVFGGRAVICFDRSSSVVGGKTQGIYVAWAYGASSVYHSADGGATWSATAAGGPSQVWRMNVSDDGVLYCTDCSNSTGNGEQNAWRYKNGVWKRLQPVAANRWVGVSSDPNTAGVVVLGSDSSTFQVSGSYGDDGSWYSAETGPPVRSNGDCAWLDQTLGAYLNMTQIEFDRVTHGLCWLWTGIGVWTFTPSVLSGGSSPPTVTLTGVNSGEEGLIINQMIKPVGKKLFATCWDRYAVLLDNGQDLEPSDDCHLSVSNNSIGDGWGCDYSKTDSNCIIFANVTRLYKSTTGGVSGSFTALPNLSTNGGKGPIAVQTENNIVWTPGNGAPIYTTDGAATAWQTCLFNGFTLTDGWPSPGSNENSVCCDLNDANTFYTFNSSTNRTMDVVSLQAGGSGYAANDILTVSGGTASTAAKIKVLTVNGSGVILTFERNIQGSYSSLPSNPVSVTGGTGSGATFNITTWGYVGGLWRSTDNGANWTNMSNGIGTVLPNINGLNLNLINLPPMGQSTQGQLLMAAGSAANHSITTSGLPLLRSIDAGATWSAVPGASLCWSVGAGKNRPGRTVPAIYFAGKCATDPNPSDPGIFRCDDISLTSTTEMPRWVRLCRAPAGNMDNPAQILGDLEQWGRFYVAMGGVGYVYGRFVA